MEKNIGKNDKFLRVVLAVAFAVVGYAYNPLWYIVALFFLFEAYAGFCVLYKILGINTAKAVKISATKKAKKKKKK